MIPLSLPAQITAAAAAMQQYRRAVLSPQGRTPAHLARMDHFRLDVLQMLDAGGALTMRQLADALPHKTLHSWSHIVAGLVESGHVRRSRPQQSPRANGVRYVLTDTGRALRASLAAALQPATPTNTEH